MSDTPLLLRPLAHTVGIWLLLTALVSARHPLRRAVLFATAALVAAVPAFYAGKALIYDARHPGGSSSIDPDPVVLWALLVFLGIAVTAVWLRARLLTRDQVPAFALTVPLATLTGYLLVSAPDLIEDLVL